MSVTKYLSSFYKSGGFLFFPWIVLVFVGCFIIPYSREYGKEVIAFGLLSFMAWGIVVVFSGRFRKFLSIAAIFTLSFLSFAKLSFYLHYKAKLSASALYVIFETNTEEASDFLGNYFSLAVIGLLLLFLLLLFFTIRNLYKEKSPVGFLRRSPLISAIVVILVVGAGYLIRNNYRQQNIIITTIGTYQDYLETKEMLAGALAKPLSDRLCYVTASQEPQTYVVVIGESTSRWHMGLYGYPRQTNPMLHEIKEELVVFDSVITPHVHTILALQKILTLSNFENPEIEETASIVQLANAAGFETYWVSNQKPVGIHESIPTLIGSAAKQHYFLTTDDYQTTIHDEKILPVLDEILTKPAKKKVIFVHLIGTHIGYERRYPKSYEHFKTIPDWAVVQNEESIQAVNAYDNATLYNDFVLRNIIDRVKALKMKSYVMYFSDHGDEVYDTIEFLGHSEHLATAPMYEIPFILWASEAIKKGNSTITSNKNLAKRRYNLEDLIHSFSALSNIKFEKIDSSRNVFGPHYQRRKRYIKKGEDYDKR